MVLFARVTPVSGTVQKQHKNKHITKNNHLSTVSMTYMIYNIYNMYDIYMRRPGSCRFLFCFFFFLPNIANFLFKIHRKVLATRKLLFSMFSKTLCSSLERSTKEMTRRKAMPCQSRVDVLISETKHSSHSEP